MYILFDFGCKNKHAVFLRLHFTCCTHKLQFTTCIYCSTVLTAVHICYLHSFSSILLQLQINPGIFMSHKSRFKNRITTILYIQKHCPFNLSSEFYWLRGKFYSVQMFLLANLLLSPNPPLSTCQCGNFLVSCSIAHLVHCRNFFLTSAYQLINPEQLHELCTPELIFSKFSEALSLAKI